MVLCQIILALSYFGISIIYVIFYDLLKKKTIISKPQNNIYSFNKQELLRLCTFYRNAYIYHLIYTLLFFILSIPIMGLLALVFSLIYFPLTVHLLNLRSYEIKIYEKDISYTYKKYYVIMNVDEVVKLKYRIFRREFVLIDNKLNQIRVKIKVENFNKLLRFIKKSIPYSIRWNSIRLFERINPKY